MCNTLCRNMSFLKIFKSINIFENYVSRHDVLLNPFPVQQQHLCYLFISQVYFLNFGMNNNETTFHVFLLTCWALFLSTLRIFSLFSSVLRVLVGFLIFVFPIFQEKHFEPRHANDENPNLNENNEHNRIGSHCGQNKTQNKSRI